MTRFNRYLLGTYSHDSKDEENKMNVDVKPDSKHVEDKKVHELNYLLVNTAKLLTEYLQSKDINLQEADIHKLNFVLIKNKSNAPDYVCNSIISLCKGMEF